MGGRRGGAHQIYHRLLRIDSEVVSLFIIWLFSLALSRCLRGTEKYHDGVLWGAFVHTWSLMLGRETRPQQKIDNTAKLAPLGFFVLACVIRSIKVVVYLAMVQPFLDFLEGDGISPVPVLHGHIFAKSPYGIPTLQDFHSSDAHHLLTLTGKKPKDIRSSFSEILKQSLSR